MSSFTLLYHALQIYVHIKFLGTLGRRETDTVRVNCPVQELYMVTLVNTGISTACFRAYPLSHCPPKFLLQFICNCILRLSDTHLNHENGYVHHSCACAHENGHGSVHGCVHDHDHHVSVHALSINNNSNNMSLEI